MSAQPPSRIPRHRGRTSINVDVDVDLADFAEDLLVEFLQDRGYTVITPAASNPGGCELPAIDRLYVAAKFRDEHALHAAVSDLLYETRGVIV